MNLFSGFELDLSSDIKLTCKLDLVSGKVKFLLLHKNFA